MMEQLCVNKSERMRWRAFNIEARAGRYRNADKLVALSFEVGAIALTGTGASHEPSPSGLGPNG